MKWHPAPEVTRARRYDTVIWTMKRRNGDTALVRTAGSRFAADVTTHTGRNDNANWPEEYDTAGECRQELERYGFRIQEVEA